MELTPWRSFMNTVSGRLLRTRPFSGFGNLNAQSNSKCSDGCCWLIAWTQETCWNIDTIVWLTTFIPACFVKTHLRKQWSTCSSPARLVSAAGPKLACFGQRWETESLWFMEAKKAGINLCLWTYSWWQPGVCGWKGTIFYLRGIQHSFDSWLARFRNLLCLLLHNCREDLHPYLNAYIQSL